MTFMALSYVIGRQIKSRYPYVNGHADGVAKILNCEFGLDIDPTLDAVTILWTGPMSQTNAIWLPDHFVPLVNNRPRSEINKDSLLVLENDKCNISDDFYTHEDESREEHALISNSSPLISIDKDLDDSHDENAPIPNSIPLLQNIGDNYSLNKDNNDVCDSTDDRNVDIKSCDDDTCSFDENNNNVCDVINEDLDKNDNSMHDENARIPNSIPLKNEFLSTLAALNLLKQNTATLLTNIPSGKKDNIAFVIDNSENTERRHRGQKSDFRDDCGQWDKTTTTRFFYILEKGEPQKVFKYQGALCKEKQVKGTRKYFPIEPQPLAEETLEIARYYSVLKNQSDYRRRITWVENTPSTYLPPSTLKLALVEYRGMFLYIRRPHGHSNNENKAANYIRTSKKIMTTISGNKRMKPTELYSKLLTEEYDSLADVPRNKQQIMNKLYYDKKNAGELVSGNLSDQIEAVLKLSGQYIDFLKKISVTVVGGKLIPSLVLFSEEQLEDVIAFCFTGRTVLGIDRTFNLGELFVTVTVYKHLALSRKRSGEHPIFIGPLFVHGGSTYEMYHHFLSTIQSVLPKDLPSNNLVVGTDDEKALTSAVNNVFPECKQALCSLHLKKNLIRHLKDKVGVDSPKRSCLVNQIFNKDGGSLMLSENEIDFEIKKNIIGESCPSQDVIYFEKVCRQIYSVLKLNWEGFLPRHWTNNNAESINHVLKQMVGWKPQQLPLLVEKLQANVKLQHLECERAIMAMGDFELGEEHQELATSQEEWIKLSTEKRKKIKEKLRKRISTNCKVQSASRILTVHTTPSKANKPNQKKRPKNSKTAQPAKKIRFV